MKKLLIILLLSGCASVDSRLDSWVGTPLTEFIRENGQPHAQHENTFTFYMGGGSYMTYVDSDLRHSKLSTCEIRITTDGMGIIRSHSHRGDC